MVGLVLVVARVREILELESLLGDGLEHGGGGTAHAEGSEHCASYLCHGLLAVLFAELLGRVAGHSVGYFVTEHDGQRGFVLGDGQQSLIDHNLAAGHAEGVDVLVLHEIEHPRVVFHVFGHAVGLEVGLHCRGQPLPHALHHGGVGGVGGSLGRFHVFAVLLVAQAEDVGVAHRDFLLTSGDGHGARCSARCKEHCCHEGNEINFQIFHFYVFF